MIHNQSSQLPQRRGSISTAGSNDSFTEPFCALVVASIGRQALLYCPTSPSGELVQV